MSLMDDSITVIRQTQQNAFEYGDEAVNKAFDLLDSAVNTANNTAWIPLQPNPSYSVTFPPPIPSWDTSIIPDTKAQSALAFLNDWLEKYRLIINENFSKLYSFDLAESEIENIIQNGYIIKKTIHDQIVTRVMDSESMKSFGLREDATKSFISKGWTIPNSILLSRIDAINADYSKNVSQAIRDQSIRE